MCFRFASMLLALWALILPSALVGQASEDSNVSTSNRLGNPPNVVDRLVFFDTPEAWAAGELDRVEIVPHSPARLTLADDRERGFPKRGRFETPVQESDFPFYELLPSWNVNCPEDTGLIFQVRTRDAENGEWSPWLYIGQWGRTNYWPGRTISFEGGTVHVDNLILRQPADAFQMRANFYDYRIERADAPTLRRLVVSYAGVVDDPEERARLTEPVVVDGQWARSLPVPHRSQRFLDRSISGSTCSPVSVSMVMAYNGVDRDVLANCMDIYDPEYGIFGNWNRAVSLPSEFGMDGWLVRVRNWDQVKAWIADGVPVIASIRFGEGEFPSNPMNSTNGHLIVVRGFNDDGSVIVNDSAHGAEGEEIVYNADELARAWFDKGGVAYIIRRPENGSFQ